MSGDPESEYLKHFKAALDLFGAALPDRGDGERWYRVKYVETVTLLGKILTETDEDDILDAASMQQTREFLEEAHNRGGEAEMLKVVAQKLWDPTRGENSLQGSRGAYQSALKTYRRLVEELGDTKAMITLADLLEAGFRGEGRKGLLALVYYMEFFELGEDVGGAAMRKTRNMLRPGPTNVLRQKGTMTFLRKAAYEKGIIEACYYLACGIQDQSDSQNGDTAEVNALLERAVEGTRIPDAPYRLSQVIFSKDEKRAVNLLECATSLGSTQAKLRLARVLGEGASEVAQDAARAKALCNEVLALERTAEVFFVLGDVEKDAKRSLGYKLAGLRMEYDQTAVVEVAELIVSGRRKKLKRKLEEKDPAQSY